MSPKPSGRRSLVAGNWKLHGSLRGSRELVAAIVAGAGDLPAVDVAVCPPFVYLPAASGWLAGSAIGLGAQDCAVESAGAYTGEVSAAMLVDVGCRYAIVGHSERRALYGDTDAVVARKALAAAQAGLIPIACVGETLAERESGTTLEVVRRQLGAVLEALPTPLLPNLVVAYEPVWAIGTGRTATPEIAQAVHADIRATLLRRDATIAPALRVLYGGSVKASNAKDLFAMQDIDGGLIGGASLQATEFLDICKAALAT
jgi:triosephosphate isomerase